MQTTISIKFFMDYICEWCGDRATNVKNRRDFPGRKEGVWTPLFVPGLRDRTGDWWERHKTGLYPGWKWAQKGGHG